MLLRDAARLMALHIDRRLRPHMKPMLPITYLRNAYARATVAMSVSPSEGNLLPVCNAHERESHFDVPRRQKISKNRRSLQDSAERAACKRLM